MQFVLVSNAFLCAFKILGIWGFCEMCNVWFSQVFEFQFVGNALVQGGSFLFGGTSPPEKEKQ